MIYVKKIHALNLYNYYNFHHLIQRIIKSFHQIFSKENIISYVSHLSFLMESVVFMMNESKWRIRTLKLRPYFAARDHKFISKRHKLLCVITFERWKEMKITARAWMAERSFRKKRTFLRSIISFWCKLHTSFSLITHYCVVSRLLFAQLFSYLDYSSHIFIILRFSSRRFKAYIISNNN